MERHQFNSSPKQTVLIFNPSRRLAGKFHSITQTATCMGVAASNVKYACDGDTIACHGVYMRQLPDGIKVEDDDMGILKLEDFDKMCGYNRKYYTNSKMTRVGMKYNTKKSKTK